MLYTPANPGSYDPDLGRFEYFWVDHQLFLLSCGYKLRPRYDPAWVPSWKHKDIPWYLCEDSNGLVVGAAISLCYTFFKTCLTTVVQKDNVLDANIGELSYPIYMCHVLVLGLITWSPLNHAPLIGSGWPRYIFTIALVIAAAFILDRVIVLPIDKLRVRFGAKNRIEPEAAFGNVNADLPAGTAAG